MGGARLPSQSNQPCVIVLHTLFAPCPSFELAAYACSEHVCHLNSIVLYLLPCVCAQMFTEAEFFNFMHNDDDLIRAAQARWMLICERSPLTGDATSSNEAKGIYMDAEPAVVGSRAEAGVQLLISDVNVDAQHARAWRDADSGDYYLQDLGSQGGTWVNGKRLGENERVRLLPQDVVEFGRHPSHEPFKVKLQHVSLKNDVINGMEYRIIPAGMHTLQPSVEREAVVV